MQDGSRNFSQTKKQGTIPARCQKRNDPCPRFSSVDKGHFWSLLVSNIIFGYLHFFFYLLLFLPVNSWNPVYFLLFFSNESTVGFVCFLWAFTKGEGRMTLNLPTTHWLSSLGSDSIFVSLPVQIPLCSAGLLCSKSVFYFAIGLYLLCCVYSIA